MDNNVKKDKGLLDENLPKILDGYCNHSSKPREIAEEEAKAFLQIMEDSADYQFGFNHSTAYSMIGYTCAYLRYHHPLEFTTAFMNNAEGDEDIANGVELAKLKGIKIENIKFRYSKGDYFYNKEENAVYKGIGSIKYLNNKKGEELYALRDNKYDSFHDVLIDVTEKTSCDTRDVKILIALDFFSEFGKNQKLLKYYEYFNDLYGAKQKKKSKVEELGYNHELFMKYSRPTAKTYMDMESDKILRELWVSIKNEELSIKEQIQKEVEYIGYPVSTRPHLTHNFAIVTELNTKYTPKFVAYFLKDGRSEKMKVAKKLFRSNEFGEFAILNVLRTQRRPKPVMVNGQWEKSKTEMETHLLEFRAN